MTDELSLRDGADEHFQVVTAGWTLNCDGNGKAVTSDGFKRADGCNRKIKKDETHLLMFAQLQPTRVVRARFCSRCAREFFDSTVE